MSESITPSILIIVASTRTQRFADIPLAWLRERGAEREDFDFEVLDLRDHPLPFYDLPASPSMARREYSSTELATIGAALDAADGFIVLTNEYNHSYSAALKNLLDHYFVEFNHKPVAFVGYGSVGGSRAVEQLRLVTAELDMASVRPAVHIMGHQMMALRSGEPARSETFAALDPRLELLFTDLHWWASALRTARHAEVHAHSA